jgi:hypothetical protein
VAHPLGREHRGGVRPVQDTGRIPIGRQRAPHPWTRCAQDRPDRARAGGVGYVSAIYLKGTDTAGLPEEAECKREPSRYPVDSVAQPRHVRGAPYLRWHGRRGTRPPDMAW